MEKFRVISSGKGKAEVLVEDKYISTLIKMVGTDALPLIKSFETAEMIFQPIRNGLTNEEQEELCLEIIFNESLSRKNKLQALLGLSLVLDGAKPDQESGFCLRFVFGKDFVISLGEHFGKLGQEQSSNQLVEYIKHKDSKRAKS